MDQQPGLARRLVIAYCFTPYQDTSGTVAAKRVRTWGEPVDVIQNEMSSVREVDPGLGAIADDLVRRRALLDTPTAFSSWASIEEFCRAGLAQVEEWLAEGAAWEHLYSRSHFVASHFLAALIKARLPHLRWTAEFSDPCSTDVAGEPRVAHLVPGPLVDQLGTFIEEAGFAVPTTDNVFEWAEVLPYALADEVLFTNANQRGYMEDHCSDQLLRSRLAAVGRVAHHPQLPERFYSLDRPTLNLDGGRVNLAYFGNFYGRRTASCLLGGMTDLPPDLRDRLKLHLFAPPDPRLERKVSRLGISASVELHPFLPFLQFLSAARQMDVLITIDALLPKNAEVNPFLLSKWGDYRGSGTPVWALVEESSVLATMSDPAIQIRTPVEHRTAAGRVLTLLARGQIQLRRTSAAPATCGGGERA